MERDQKRKGSTRVTKNITTVYLLFMLGVYLLYPGFGGYAEITAQKWHCYEIFTGLYFFAMVILSLEFSLIGENKLVPPREVWRHMCFSQKLIIGYWSASALSTMLAIDRSVAFWGSDRCEGLLAISFYCGSFLLISFHEKLKTLMIWIFGIAMSANCVLAMIQFSGHNPFSLYPQGMNYYDAYIRYEGEFLGTFGNVDILSAAFCVAIPCFWIAMITLQDRKRMLLIVPLAMCLFVLLKSFVAGGIVGICGSAVLSLPVLAKDKKRRSRLATASFAVMFFGLIGTFFLGSRIGGFVAEASALMHGHWEDSFGSGRIYIWRNVLKLFPDRLLFGGGPDTLGLRMDAVFERYDPALGVTICSTIDVAHNEYLNILANQGLIALVLYLAALFCAARYWIRNAAYDPVTAICGGAVLGYCIQAFFGISSPISAPYFWIAFALLVSRENVLAKAPAIERKRSAP